LQRDGHDVRGAVDAPTAMDAIEAFAPMLLLMDIQLPGVDGFELTRRLKAEARTQHIRIIAVTAYAMKGDDQRARMAGCDGYITKPIDTRALPGVVAAQLAAITAAG
jgi:CheY-like chemotaxis protein